MAGICMDLVLKLGVVSISVLSYLQFTEFFLLNLRWLWPFWLSYPMVDVLLCWTSRLKTG